MNENEKPVCKYQRVGVPTCAIDHSYCEYEPLSECDMFKPVDHIPDEDKIKIEMADDILNKFGVDLEKYMYLMQSGEIDIECRDFRNEEIGNIQCMELTKSQEDWLSGSSMSFQELMSSLLNVEMRRVKERDKTRPTSWKSSIKLWECPICNFVMSNLTYQMLNNRTCPGCGGALLDYIMKEE